MNKYDYCPRQITVLEFAQKDLLSRDSDTELFTCLLFNMNKFD